MNDEGATENEKSESISDSMRENYVNEQYDTHIPSTDPQLVDTNTSRLEEVFNSRLSISDEALHPASSSLDETGTEHDRLVLESKKDDDSNSSIAGASADEALETSADVQRPASEEETKQTENDPDVLERDTVGSGDESEEQNDADITFGSPEVSTSQAEYRSAQISSTDMRDSVSSSGQSSTLTEVSALQSDAAGSMENQFLEPHIEVVASDEKTDNEGDDSRDSNQTESRAANNDGGDIAASIGFVADNIDQLIKDSVNVHKSPSPKKRESRRAVSPSPALIDPKCVKEVNRSSEKLVAAVFALLDVLQKQLHEMSALTTGYVQVHRDIGFKVTESVDDLLRALYSLISKIEQIDLKMAPVYELGAQVKRLRTSLEQLDKLFS